MLKQVSPAYRSAVHNVRGGACIILSLAVILLIAMTPIDAPASSEERAFDLADSLENTYQREQASLRGFTLDDYLTYAALNNPGLRASFYRWKSELERSLAASSLPDPVLSYSYFIEHVETRVGPQNHRFSLKQAFPWFGTLGAKGTVALETAHAAYEEFRSAKLKLFYEVKKAYYDYYVLGREIEIAGANIELLEFWESVARAKYRAATGEHRDLIKAQVELGILEDRLLSLEKMKNPSVAALREALGLLDATDLPVPGEIPDIASSIDADTMKSDIIRNNPGLRAVAHLVSREQASVRLAGKKSLPTFMLGIDYIQTGDAADPAMIESGKDPWILSASVTLPIWFGKNRAARDQAKARLRMARHDHSNRRNALIALAERVVFEYEDASRKVELYQGGLIPKAEQSLNASYAAYRAGEADFLSVIDAQRLLIDFQLQLEYARARKATKLAEIEMLSGRER